MNKILLDAYLGIHTKLVVKVAGNFLWKKVLRNNGVKNINILSEGKKDEILDNIYSSLFKESQKDKKISLKGIGKTYENGFKAIHNFNLDVNPKEFVCLLGPSGCGKTTALRMVAGLESITEGKYIAGSQEMNSVHPSERNTAMVFQNYALYPFMTVYDNIAFGLKLKTFKNPVYKNLLKEFYDHYLPNHEIIRDLKFKVFDLSHEGKSEINEKKIIHRKLAKEGKDSEAMALNEEIKKLLVVYRDSKNRNSSEIIKTNEEIKKLKIEQKETYRKIIEIEKAKIGKSKEKIQKLLEEQKKYKEQKTADDTNLLKQLESLKDEKKSIDKNLTFIENVIAKIDKQISTLEGHIKSQEKSIEKIKSKDAVDENKISILNDEIKNNKSKIKIANDEKKSKVKELNAIKKEANAQEEILNNFKQKHAEKIPVIKEVIRLLKLEQKDEQHALSKKLRETFRLAKDEKNLVIVNKGKKDIETMENNISEIGVEILENIDKISIINKRNKFIIRELKGKTSLRKSIKTNLSESAIIWKKTIPTRVRQLSTLVGIRDYLKRKPAALSGGQRQRVALIRAISKNSQLFLFDEPLSNLDAKLRSTMRSEIRKIHKSVGATSLYVTHDQIEAMTMADKVVVINLGYIQQVGSPRDLYENPSNVFVARFIGVPTINMMEVDLDTAKNEYKVAGKIMKYKLSAEKTKRIKSSKETNVLLGIRPNDIVLSKPTENGLIGKVEEKELIGSEYVIDMKLKSGKVVKALASVHDHVKIGEEFNIEFAPNKVSFFSKTTGKAISSVINVETAAALKVWDDSVEERIKNLMILDKDRNAKTIGKKLVDKVKESTNQEFRKTQLHKKIDELQDKKEDYKVFDEDEINS